MVSHVTSLISTACDTLEGYFLDQLRPWKIITLSVAITVTVKAKITGVRALKSSPAPAVLSDGALKARTPASLSVCFAERCSAQIFLTAGACRWLFGENIRNFYTMKKIVRPRLFEKPLSSALSLSFASWNTYILATTYFQLIFIVLLTLLRAHFAAGFKSTLSGNCRHRVNKCGKQNRTNEWGMKIMIRGENKMVS